MAQILTAVYKQNLKKYAAIIHVDMDYQITIAGTTVDVTDLS
ncbi:MAG TPA: hypothetical protein VF220_03030 [Nitrososphaeraceae archaeon]